MIEVEVKARVEDPDRILGSLMQLGAVTEGSEHQSDTYFNNRYRDFAKTDEALRIRVNDGKNFLTYKGPKIDMVSKTREEIQVEINDSRNMINILSSIGFYPVAAVVKKRKKFRAGDFIIALDDVEGLGNFIEIEMTSEDARNCEEKVDLIFNFMEKLGISRFSTIRKSYLEMILEKK